MEMYVKRLVYGRTSIPPVAPLNLAKERWRQIGTYLWIGWATLLLSVYYKQIWLLFVTPFRAWVADNHSLDAARRMLYILFIELRTGGQLPAAQEALSRSIEAIVGAALILATAYTLGAGVQRLLRWHPDHWVDGLLYRMALGFGLFSHLLLAAAGLGIYRSPVILTFSVFVLVSGTGFFLRRLHLRSPRIYSVDLSTPVRSWFQADRIWKAIAVLALLIAAIGALAPEKEYDALWYHLWLPKLWLEHGRPVDIVSEYISLYPLTWDLLFGAAMTLGGPVAAKFLHFACLPLAGLLVYRLTQHIAPLASPWLSVALFVTVPIVLWQATTAYIDLALAFHVGLVIYALIRYVEARQWQWLALAIINLGVALGTKHLALLVLALIVPALALRLWLQDRNIFRAVTPAILLGVSLLFPLPYYLRAWMLSGNPVFPELFGLFGALPPERWSEITEQGLANFKANFGDPMTLQSFLLLPWNMTVHASSYGGSLGPLFLLLLPALILRRGNRITLWLLFFVLGYVTLWASPISSFQMRFLVPMTPFMAVLAAEAYRRLQTSARDSRWQKHLICWGVAGLLLLNLPPFLSLHERNREVWDGWLTHVVHEVPVGVVIGYHTQDDFLAQEVASYNAWRFINNHLPADARILTFAGGDHLYSERARIGSDSTLARKMTWGSPGGYEAQALEALQQHEISHILFDKRQLARIAPDALAIAQPDVVNDWFELEYQDARFSLYRLRGATISE